MSDNLVAETVVFPQPEELDLCLCDEDNERVTSILERVKLSQDDPAIFLGWNQHALQAFAVAAAALPPPHPVWVQVPISCNQLQSDIVAKAGAVAGGTHHNFCFAPNDLVQMNNVMKQLNLIESEQWVQVQA